MKYEIKKNTNELDINFKIRKKFIEYLNPTNKKQLLLYTNYSNILINIIFLGNKYRTDQYDLIIDTLIYNTKKNRLFKEIYNNFFNKIKK